MQSDVWRRSGRSDRVWSVSPLVIIAVLAVVPLLPRLGAEPATVAVAADDARGPTFSEDIAPIVMENCASCHRPGEAAPFPLIEYEDVREHARLIALVTRRGIMPPWRAEPSDFVKFADERRLSDEQIALLGAWFEAGMPEGNPGKLPPVPDFPEGWQLGEPDLVLEMSEAYEVPAEGRDIYRNFVLPVPIDEPKYLRAIEFRPSSPEVVHHAIFFTDDSGAARRQDAADDSAPGYRSMGGPGVVPSGRIGGWAVGAQPVQTPQGTAYEITPGTDLIAELHFNLSGRVQHEQSRIGLHFADEPPTRHLQTLRMGVTGFTVPAGESDHVLRSSYTLPVDVELVGLWPHAHYLAREMEIIATFPDGRREHLLHITDWDFNWQERYQYAEPVHLPAGAEVEMVFTYDNSANNPRNPHHPPRDVSFGLQSEDEMAFTWLEVIPPSEEDAVALLRAQIEQEGPRILGELLGAGEISEELLIRVGEQVINDPQASPQERAFAQRMLERVGR